MIRVFFDACHRHGWLPGLAASATIYVEELPFHHDQIARFIPEYVMAQLESDAAIAKIPHLTTRHLIVVMIETGLRGGDACTLPFNPVLTDSSGWPCLRFEAVKVRAEQLIPLSARATVGTGTAACASGGWRCGRAHRAASGGRSPAVTGPASHAVTGARTVTSATRWPF